MCRYFDFNMFKCSSPDNLNPRSPILKPEHFGEGRLEDGLHHLLLKKHLSLAQQWAFCVKGGALCSVGFSPFVALG